jgi:hypothetical protein
MQEVRQLVPAKHRLYNKFIGSGRPSSFTDCRKIRNEAKFVTRFAKTIEQDHIAGNFKNNPKLFWNYIDNITISANS